MKTHQILCFTLAFALITLTGCEQDYSEDISLPETNLQPTQKVRCASEEHMKKLLEDPAYVTERNKRLAAFKKFTTGGIFKAACTGGVLIPVAVHYQGVNSNDRTCLTSLAVRQIEILNADYAGTNGDISKWTNQAAYYFPGISNGETCIRFVLADQNHPTGFGLSNGDQAVTINQTSGDQVNAWSGYLNIFVQTGTGYLGYAPLGGAGNGDGVVIEATAFGAGAGCGSISPETPYNLGRTVTHEVGHYLLLDHIWGNGCGVDDGVSDTPDQSNDYGGCPILGESSCGSNDMHMNYMDYTNDACMYMFSSGQSSRMESYLSSSLSNLTNNVSAVYSGSDSGTDPGTDPDPNPNPDPVPETDPDPPIACAAPATSSIDVLSETKVIIDWADIPDARRYRVRYRAVIGGQWSVSAVSVSERSLNNLQAGVMYEYQLRTRCPGGWTNWSSKNTFEIPSGENESLNGYTIRITLDNYGSETFWYIVDENGYDLYSGGPYEDNAAGSIIEQNLDLLLGCYTLDINDTWGDGMCCDYGQGSIEILDATNQSVVFSDGFFGTYTLIDFCIEDSGLRIRHEEKDNKKALRGNKVKSK